MSDKENQQQLESSALQFLAQLANSEGKIPTDDFDPTSWPPLLPAKESTRKRASEHYINIDTLDNTKSPQDNFVDRKLLSLKKNRIAAIKSRQKKKEYTETLRQRMTEMEFQNMTLRQLTRDLRQDLFSLQSQLLTHIDCECSNIHYHVNLRELQ